MYNEQPDEALSVECLQNPEARHFIPVHGGQAPSSLYSFNQVSLAAFIAQRHAVNFLYLL